MLNPLEYQFENTLKSHGYDVIVNGTDQIRILLREYAEGTSSSEYKYMMFRNGLAKQGDIVAIFDDNWLVLHEDVSINNVYTKVIIRRLKFNINFNFAGDKIAIPSAIDEGAYRTINGQYIALPEGRIILHMQESEISKRIKKEQRLIIMGNAWKIIQKTNPEHGLYKIYADIDIFNVDDDKENEIADRWKYESPNNYTITINNVVDGALPLDSTLQLDITVTNNGEVVTVPITYTSSNPDILIVDGGLVSCVGVGSANITVAVTDDLTVTDTIRLGVEEVGEDNFAIQITGQDSIMIMSEGSYTAKVFNNGTEVMDKSVVFSVSPTSLATIKSQGDNKCIVKANTNFNTGEVMLKAKFVDDETIFIDKKILITGY